MQRLRDAVENMLRETIARGDTIAPGYRDEILAIVRTMVAEEREACALACEQIGRDIVCPEECAAVIRAGMNKILETVDALEIQRNQVATILDNYQRKIIELERKLEEAEARAARLKSVCNRMTVWMDLNGDNLYERSDVKVNDCAHEIRAMKGTK